MNNISEGDWLRGSLEGCGVGVEDGVGGRVIPVVRCLDVKRWAAVLVHGRKTAGCKSNRPSMHTFTKKQNIVKIRSYDY